MIESLLFDFTVDRTNNTIKLTREFAADLDLVWDAFTKAEILDQWFAPEPFRLKTKEMNFQEGGRWLYSMVSPENVSMWALVNFLRIEPKLQFTSQNSFCDENGNANNPAFTFSITETHFKAGEDVTTVQIVKKMADLAQLEKFVSLGWKDGMALTMKKLDELLEKLSKK